MRHPGGMAVVIETEYEPARTVEADARNRLGRILDPEGRTHGGGGRGSHPRSPWRRIPRPPGRNPDRHLSVLHLFRDAPARRPGPQMAALRLATRRNRRTGGLHRTDVAVRTENRPRRRDSRTSRSEHGAHAPDRDTRPKPGSPAKRGRVPAPGGRRADHPDGNGDLAQRLHFPGRHRRRPRHRGPQRVARRAGKGVEDQSPRQLAARSEDQLLAHLQGRARPVEEDPGSRRGRDPGPSDRDGPRNWRTSARRP